MAKRIIKRGTRYRRVHVSPLRLCCCICLAIVVFPTFIILLLYNVGYSTSLDQPNKHPIADLNQPALGLYISPSYATAAIAYADGKVEHLGKVEGSNAYTEVIQRLQKRSSVHLRKPYYGMLFGPPLSERARQWLRSFRRRLGLPASADVGRLAKPLVPLVRAAKARLGYRPVDGLLVATGIRALYDEDVLDIMTYLGLRQLPLRHSPHLGYGCEQPKELAAAYAGWGFGLCDTYWNSTACDEEEENMPFEIVVGVSYSRTGIALSQAGFRAAYVGSGYDETLTDAVGFDGLGGDAWGDAWRSGREKKEQYWRFVHEKLKGHLHQNNRYNVSRVLLFDETVDEPLDDHTAGDEMEVIIRRVVKQWQEDVEVLKDDAVYVTAIGAARLAVRGRYVGLEGGEEGGREGELRKRFPNPLDCSWFAADLLD